VFEFLGAKPRLVFEQRLVEMLGSADGKMAVAVRERVQGPLRRLTQPDEAIKGRRQTGPIRA
jgi:hypothetical protein